MKMHEHCSRCGLKYKIEPNFFFGAMYVSYGLAIIFGMIIFAAANFVFDADIASSFISILIGLVVSMPILTRWSRNIYINMFINYKPDAARNYKT